MIENEVTRGLLKPKMLRVWILIFAAPILLVCVTTVAIVIMVRMAGGDQSVILQGLTAWFPYIVMVNHTSPVFINEMVRLQRWAYFVKHRLAPDPTWLAVCHCDWAGRRNRSLLGSGLRV